MEGKRNRLPRESGGQKQNATPPSIKWHDIIVGHPSRFLFRLRRHVKTWQLTSARASDMLSECCRLVRVLLFLFFVRSLKLGQRSAQSLCTNKKTDGRACWTGRGLPWPLESRAMWDWRVVWWTITRCSQVSPEKYSFDNAVSQHWPFEKTNTKQKVQQYLSSSCKRLL